MIVNPYTNMCYIYCVCVRESCTQPWFDKWFRHNRKTYLTHTHTKASCIAPYTRKTCSFRLSFHSFHVSNLVTIANIIHFPCCFTMHADIYQKSKYLLAINLIFRLILQKLSAILHFFVFNY